MLFRSIANIYPRKTIQFIEQQSEKRFPVIGWGFVTGPIRVSAARTMISWMRNNEHVVEKLIMLDPFCAYLDYFAPIFMHLSGGNVYHSGYVGECLRDKRWKKKKYALLHQYREKIR